MWQSAEGMRIYLTELRHLRESCMQVNNEVVHDATPAAVHAELLSHGVEVTIQHSDRHLYIPTVAAYKRMQHEC